MVNIENDSKFVRQFANEVHNAYQRQGSKLRKTVRTKNQVTGKSTTFQKIGTGTATTKARHGTIPPMALDHTPIECSLSDWYAGNWVDKLDELKTEHDDRRVVASAAAWALGRKTDEQIVTVLDSTTNEETAATALTKAKIYSAFETLGNNDVFEEGKMFALVGYQQWTDLLNLPEFASSDYIGVNELPFIKEGTEAKRWMGTIWMTHSGLPLNGAVRKCFWYRDDAIGHASGSEVTTDITWHGDRASHFVHNMMSQGACLVDDKGVVEMQCTET
ncbi:MAG: phage capsid protein [Gammaproteobacteria bacterium]